MQNLTAPTNLFVGFQVGDLWATMAPLLRGAPESTAKLEAIFLGICRRKRCIHLINAVRYITAKWRIATSLAAAIAK